MSMHAPMFAPGTEYILTLNNKVQLATGGFEDVQSLFSVVKALWEGKQEGSITTWTADRKTAWSKIDTYESLLNPYTIVAVLDVRGTDQVSKIS